MAINFSNMDIINENFSCGCKPREEIKTMYGWKMQGMQVQKGQKGTRLNATVVKTILDKETNKEKVIRFPKKNGVHVWCKCQVQPMSDKLKNYLEGKGKTQKERKRTEQEIQQEKEDQEMIDDLAALMEETEQEEEITPEAAAAVLSKLSDERVRELFSEVMKKGITEGSDVIIHAAKMAL